MTKLERLREHIENNPCHVSFGDLKRLLESLGFTHKGGKGTSHHAFVHPAGFIVPVVHRRPFVLACYVKKALRVIEQLEELGESDG